MNLLIKFPTRNRPAQFFQVLELYLKKLKNPSRTKFLITIDEDDSSMNNGMVVQKIAELNRRCDNILRTVIGASGSKIAAVNRDINHIIGYDIILLASDDMIPIIDGYDEIIREKMSAHFPDTDGCLWFNDGYTGTRLNTLCILGKKYFEQFGYIYHPSYKSLWCDNEYTEVAQKLQKIIYDDRVIIKHEHPSNIGNAKLYDSLYMRNDSLDPHDREMFKQRKAKNFSIDEILTTSIPVVENLFQPIENTKWSILICSLYSRTKSLSILVEKLKKQISENNLQNDINIVVDVDGGEKIVGQKRQDLVNKCCSEYCCFIDDDDDISDDYIIKNWEGILKNSDCNSLVGEITTNGKNKKIFIHSLKYESYFEKNGIYYRPPNHLNVIKTCFVKEIGFVATMKTGEDTEFSMRMCIKRLLKTEHEILTPYYFYHYITNK